MRVLVCGGRDFTDQACVFRVLDHLHARRPFTLLIEGGATGADALARQWAADRGVPNKTFHAEWDRHGRAAGPMRNTRMLAEGAPDLVVAFTGSRGTADMIRQARAAGVRVVSQDERRKAAPEASAARTPRTRKPAAPATQPEPQPPCHYCGTPATLLCDYVIGRPAEPSDALRPPFTCDRPLCSGCTTRTGWMHLNMGRKRHVWDSFDRCPEHVGAEDDLRPLTDDEARAIQRRLRMRLAEPAT